jgi:hypothetical protein
MTQSATTTFKYNYAASLFATAGLDWLTCVPHAILLNAAYAPQPSHQFLSDIPVGAVMQDVAMTSVGQLNGICYGLIPQFNAFISATPVVALAIYSHTGDPTTSVLIYYSADGFGFPFLPQGFNYAVGFDQTAGGFFQV